MSGWILEKFFTFLVSFCSGSAQWWAGSMTGSLLWRPVTLVG